MTSLLISVVSTMISLLLTSLWILGVIIMMRIPIFVVHILQRYMSVPLVTAVYNITGLEYIYNDAVLDVFRTYKHYYIYKDIPIIPHLNVLLFTIPCSIEAIAVSIISSCIILIHIIYKEMEVVLLVLSIIPICLVYNSLHPVVLSYVQG